MWRNPDRIARETPSGEPQVAGIEAAEKFAADIAERLGVDSDHVMPAYEDAAHWMVKEES